MSKQYLQEGWGGECGESEYDGMVACQSSACIKVSVCGHVGEGKRV
jgi:hypothetical protein